MSAVFGLLAYDSTAVNKNDTIESNAASCKISISAEAERLLTQYGNSILRLAYCYLHNISDAEDILQDTLIQFIKAEPQFETHTHEKAWLMRVAISQILTCATSDGIAKGIANKRAMPSPAFFRSSHRILLMRNRAPYILKTVCCIFPDFLFWARIPFSL